VAWWVDPVELLVSKKGREENGMGTTKKGVSRGGQWKSDFKELSKPVTEQNGCNGGAGGHPLGAAEGSEGGSLSIMRWVNRGGDGPRSRERK